MVDEEVENILAEIRESVRARSLPVSEIATTPAENGDEPLVFPDATRDAVETTSSEALARLESYLGVTARAWDRLPPLVSNRSGSVARLELWAKRHLKRATRWYAWEQVNFNAAVHHALRDILQALSAYQQELKELRAETRSQRAMIERNHEELKAQREEASAEREKHKAERTEFDAQRRKSETQRAELKAQLANLEAHGEARAKEMDARLLSLAQQMQERVNHVQEEQRVCFKQLSLEATEAAVLEDRARRKTESLLGELRRRLDQIENSEK
jgi:hypothetical protein